MSSKSFEDIKAAWNKVSLALLWNFSSQMGSKENPKPASVIAVDDLTVQIVYHMGSATAESRAMYVWLNERNIPFRDERSHYHFERGEDATMFMMFWGGT